MSITHDFFKNVIFPSKIIAWNELNRKIKNSETIETLFKKSYHILGHLQIAHLIA